MSPSRFPSSPALGAPPPGRPGLRDHLLGVMLDHRYRIDALIARGGMSSVYLAMDTRLDRPVAVKVVDPRYAADPQFVDRLEMEARAVARLKDPGLVAVYDQGVDGEFAFLVMELVEGGTLRELLRERGPMPPHAVSAVLSPMLGGLAAAHRAGLLHRDIKPENVLISDSGEVKVVDFGLVRAVAAVGITSQSVILGTAAYLSPEQVELNGVDARSDVYSAGIMTFEMFTGTVPFDGDTPLGLAYARTKADVPRPSSLIDGVPAEFDEFVVRATARDPRQRYADAGEMRSALKQLTSSLGLAPFTVPAPARSAERVTVARYRASLVESEGTAATTAQPSPAFDPPRQPTRVQTAPPFSAAAPGPAPHTAALPVVAPDSLSPHPRLVDAAAGYSEQRRRSRRRAAILVTIIVLLAALLGVGGWWLGSSQFTEIPSVAGMNRLDGHKTLTSAGLKVSDKPVYSDAIAQNTVIDTNPGPRARITRLSSVTMNYSMGKPTVPQINTSTSAKDAQVQLRERALTSSVTGEQFSRYPAGAVLSVSPDPGTPVNVGSNVELVVSKGPATTVPNLSGMSPDQARRTLADVGLTASDAGKSADGSAPVGTITKSDPGFGQPLTSGNITVRIYVSDAVEVPDVTGDSVGDARRAIEDAGLSVRVRGLTRSPYSVVIYQSVAAGTRVTGGTEIEIGAIP